MMMTPAALPGGELGGGRAGTLAYLSSPTGAAQQLGLGSSPGSPVVLLPVPTGRSTSAFDPWAAPDFATASLRVV